MKKCNVPSHIDIDPPAPLVKVTDGVRFRFMCVECAKNLGMHISGPANGAG